MGIEMNTCGVYVHCRRRGRSLVTPLAGSKRFFARSIFGPVKMDKGYCLRVILRHRRNSQSQFTPSSAAAHSSAIPPPVLPAKFIILSPAVCSLWSQTPLPSTPPPTHPPLKSSSPSSFTMFRSALRQSTRSVGAFSAGRIVAVCSSGRILTSWHLEPGSNFLSFSPPEKATCMAQLKPYAVEDVS